MRAFFSGLTAPACTCAMSSGFDCDDLALAERFLDGEPVQFPLVAKQIVEAIYSAGASRYPSLWSRCRDYFDR